MNDQSHALAFSIGSRITLPLNFAATAGRRMRIRVVYGALEVLTFTLPSVVHS
jgi:hypothetical protein